MVYLKFSMCRTLEGAHSNPVLTMSLTVLFLVVPSSTPWPSSIK